MIVLEQEEMQNYALRRGKRYTFFISKTFTRWRSIVLYFKNIHWGLQHRGLGVEIKLSRGLVERCKGKENRRRKNKFFGGAIGICSLFQKHSLGGVTGTQG